MRKAILAVSIILLALLAVTCDSPLVLRGTDPAQLNAEELEWVTITIADPSSSDQARGLIESDAKTQAQGANGVYEVVFMAGDTIVRSTKTSNGSGGFTGGAWEVTVPAVNYSAPGNDAVLFAGVTVSATEDILLAIGKISSGTNLITAPAQIIFTMVSIKSGVNTDISLSSFQIENPGAYKTQELTSIPADAAGAYANIPQFLIPPNYSGVKASWKFTNQHLASAVLRGNIIVEDEEIGADVDISIGGYNIAYSALSDIPVGNDPITFDIETTGSERGLCKIYIEVPVAALSSKTLGWDGTKGIASGTVAATVRPWFIKGGLLNDDLDQHFIDNGGTGDIPANTGGAVLINVGETYIDTSVVAGPTWQ